MKKLILLFFLLSLVACSPQTEPVETPEADNNDSNQSVTQPESTPEVTIDVDTIEASLTDIDVIEDEFTASTTYGDASFGEAIFIAKCQFCLILPDTIVSPESDLADVYAKAIYYANGEVSPEGYLFNTIQENEYNTLTTNETYHVIAYLKDSYDAEIATVIVASTATPEPETTPEETAVVEVTPETTEPETTPEETAVAEATPETTEPVDTAAESPDGESPIVDAVANADPAQGEQLFTMNPVTPCNTCHLVDSEAMLVGPGLLNVGERAETRIEGMAAEEYLYESIVHPNDFIVEGFAGAMPTNYGDMLSDEEIYDIIAYMLSLGE